MIDKETPARRAIGKDLSTRVAEKLVQDVGEYEFWYKHRRYCGHGLIYLDSRIQLVEVLSGSEGQTLREWADPHDFVDWLARQTDYSLSGADPSQPELATASLDESSYQNITRDILLDFLHGGTGVLAIFREYLEIMDQEFRFLVDDYGFRKLPPERLRHESVVTYQKSPNAGLSVTREFSSTPWIEISLKSNEPAESYINKSLDKLASQRVEDWTTPAFGGDKTGDDEQSVRVWFRAYAEVLRDHFQDLLLPDSGNAVSTTNTRVDFRTSHSIINRLSTHHWRLAGIATAGMAFLLLVLELRYFNAHGTPTATGSAYANLGMLLLMSVPWVLLAAGLLFVVLGTNARDLDKRFNERSIWQRIAIAGGILSVLIGITAIAALVA